MAKKTNRREFVQAAGMAASGLMAAAAPWQPQPPSKGRARHREQWVHAFAN